MRISRRRTGGLASWILLGVLNLSGLAPAADTVGFWRLNEGQGQFAADSSEFANRGTLGVLAGADPSDPTWIGDGFRGEALRFNGNQFVSVKNSSALEPQAITVEAWVRCAPPGPPFGYMVSKYRQYVGFSSYALVASRTGFSFYIGGRSAFVRSPIFVPPPSWYGRWHHLAGTYDGVAVRLYADGVEIGGGTPASLPIFYIGRNLVDRLYLGAPYDVSGAPGQRYRFVGDLDDVRVWSRALSPDEIRTRAAGSELPGTVVIDFEDLTDPTPVLSQYADRGITFNGPQVIDEAARLSSPSFAHSGTRAIEQCVSKEFCSTPIEMRFTRPQSRLRVWVGFSNRLAQARRVLLRGYDAAGGNAGQASVVLNPADAVQPIRFPLEVRLDAPAISRATVEFENGSYMNSLSVDDVEFDGGGGRPACGSTADPVLVLDSPADGYSTQVNEYFLQGRIDTTAPLEEATLTIAGNGSSATSSLFALGVVTTVGGRFGPFRLDGGLSPGINTVIVRVRDCRGTAEVRRRVEFTPFPPGTRIEFLGMEVTQAIQDPAGDVPLVAGKRTFARVYLGEVGPGMGITRVSGTLSAYHRSARTPYSSHPFDLGDTFSPPRVESLDSIDVHPGSDLDPLRRDLGASLNFELPGEWVQPGEIHMEITLKIEGNPSGLPCDGCENTFEVGSFFSNFINFYPVPPVEIELWSVPYRQGGNVYRPTETDLALLESWLRRAYPTGQVHSRRMSFDVWDSRPEAWDVNYRFFLINLFRFCAFTSCNPSLRYYGLISDLGGFTRGQASGIPGLSAAGPAGMPGNCLTSWDVDRPAEDGPSSYADWYGGHEIGHIYGRRHPGFTMSCSTPQDKDDYAYPYADGLIGDQNHPYFGFDVGDQGNRIQPRIYPYDQWSDMMTYNTFEWISDYTYLGIWGQLISLGGGGGEVASSLAPARLAAPGPSEGLLVAGILNLTRGTLALKPFSRLAGLQPTALPPESPFGIVLLDVKGAILGSYPFEPQPFSDVSPGEDQLALVAQVVPYLEGTSRIIIIKKDQELASRVVTAAKPWVHLLSPNGGESLQGPLAQVSWEAADPDGDDLSYTLLYSHDGGESWDTVGVDISAPRYQVNIEELPGSRNALFRVIASDGVNTAYDDSDRPFLVVDKAPRPHITAPQDGSTVSPDHVVVLAGEAFDPEEGDLNGESLRWISDRGGFLGTGRMISASGLVPGTHRITLSAIDGNGNESIQEVAIVVTRKDPIALAGSDRTVTRGSVVELDGGKSLGTGDLEYHWRFLAAPAGSGAVLLPASAAQTSLVADLPGDYLIQLLITDESGAAAADQVLVTSEVPTRGFLRGDVAPDGVLDITDPIAIRAYLFTGGSAPACKKAADVDDNGQVEITDGVVLLSYLFQGGHPPAPPFPTCGPDPTDDPVDCQFYPPCALPK